MKGMELIIGFSHCCCSNSLGFVGANNSVWDLAKSNSWLELYTHIWVLIRRRHQARHLCCSCSSPTLPGYLQHQLHLKWRWRNKGLACAQDVRGQLQMGCDSRGLQIAGISSWVEITEMRRNRKVCDALTLCLRGSLYPFQLMSASRPPVLVSAHSVCSDCCWPCLWPRISAMSHGGLSNNAWPTLSGRRFFWHLAWNYSATASWWAKLFKDQGESFSPLLPHESHTVVSSTWHMWQSGTKMCAVIFNGIAF